MTFLDKDFISIALSSPLPSPMPIGAPCSSSNLPHISLILSHPFYSSPLTPFLNSALSPKKHSSDSSLTNEG